MTHEIVTLAHDVIGLVALVGVLTIEYSLLESIFDGIMAIIHAIDVHRRQHAAHV
jgi:hypothetical protein